MRSPRYPQPQRRFLPLFLVCVILALGGVIAWYVTKKPSAEAFASASELQRALPLPREVEYPQGALPPVLPFDKLELKKGDRRLLAYNKGKVVRVYAVALGAAPVGHKEREGDNKTPEGLYAIDGKNPDSAYYKNMGVSYPNAQDKARAKQLGASPGGDIKIHGLAPHFADVGIAHRMTDWTFGCIAVANEEMEELFQRVAVGTPIEIFP